MCEGDVCRDNVQNDPVVLSGDSVRDECEVWGVTM